MTYAKILIGAGSTEIANSDDRDLRTYEFNWGDGRLIDVSVSLNEGNNLSTCSFSIYDKDRTIANDFFTYVKNVEGLEPNQLQQRANNTPASSSLAGEAPNSGVYGGVTLNQTQVDNAFKVASSVKALGGSTRDIETALITVMQESSLVFQKGGDRDSVGWYQQREPWGDYATRTDIGGSTGLFLKGGKAPGTPGLFSWTPRNQNPSGYDRAVAAQGVQRSAFPDKYANWLPMAEALIQAMNVDAVSTPTDDTQDSLAINTTPVSVEREATLAGQQITIFLGFDNKPSVGYSFIHTGIQYDLYDNSILKFDGTAAAFVLHQSKKNSAYINITLKELAEKISSNYGLTVDMTVEGPKYVYIQQKAETDWELLTRECDRIGLIIKNVGDNKIQIKARSEMLVDLPVWRLKLGENLTNFSVSHKANSTQGARSAEPGDLTSTGVKKYNIDPDTGLLVQEETTKSETLGSQNTASTIGVNLASIKPLTDGVSDLADSNRKANEQRVKGIVATFETPTTSEILKLTPDDVLLTEGITEFLDRVWVIEEVSHTLSASSGWKTTGTVYSPLRNKYPTQNGSIDTAQSDQKNPNGFIFPTKTRLITSPFGPRSSGTHKGIDIGTPTGENCFASAGGVVSQVVTGCKVGDRSCGGRYGNVVYITHPGGFETRYAHLSEVEVSQGQTVSQGQLIGRTGNTGDSSGPHLHHELRLNGVAKDPLQFIK
jgi:murein DD-endopeptidase MepM/ murein hydrolase activator NlpD